MRISAGTPAALAAVSLPVTIALYPPTAVPLAVIVVTGIGIVIWHLARGGRATVRRSPKGYISLTLDSTRKRR
jgi:hypothetical protein